MSIVLLRGDTVPLEHRSTERGHGTLGASFYLEGTRYTWNWFVKDVV